MNYKGRNLISVAITIPLLLLRFADYYWQQIHEFASPIGITAMFILILLVVGKLVFTAIKVVKNWVSLNFKMFVPSLIYLTALSLVITNPKCLGAETYQGAIMYRGCYEGTMNTATVKFRESGKFEYRHVGFFGITSFITGTWKQSDDTLMIDFKNRKAKFVGDTLLLTENSILRIQGDSLMKGQPRFYRGYCKSRN